MHQMMLYSKVVTIRDAQLNEKKVIQKEKLEEEVRPPYARTRTAHAPRTHRARTAHAPRTHRARLPPPSPAAARLARRSACGNAADSSFSSHGPPSTLAACSGGWTR